MALTLKVNRLTDTAKLPTYAHDGDACFDLYADSVISSHGGTVFTCGTRKKRFSLILSEDLQVKNSPQREGFQTRSKQMKNNRMETRRTT